MSNTRVKDADQPWCVYVHYEGNDPVYIGSGTLHRCMDFAKDKRSEEHYDWFQKQILAKNTSFIKIVFLTHDHEEARYVENRLIPEFKPRYNKTLNKLTFDDILTTQELMARGHSIRSIAPTLDIYHNNLCQLLKLPYVHRDYTVVQESVTHPLVCN